MEDDWEVSPAETIDLHEDAPAEMRVRNRGKRAFTYKIKTNAPAAYTVSPSQGTVESNSEVTIKISLKPPAAPRPKHKFQVLLTPFAGSELQAALLSVHYTTALPLPDDSPLRSTSPLQTASSAPIPVVVTSAEEAAVSELEATRKQLIALSERAETVSEEVRSLRRQLATALHRQEFARITKQKAGICVFCGLYQGILGLTLGLLVSRLV